MLSKQEDSSLTSTFLNTSSSTSSSSQRTSRGNDSFDENVRPMSVSSRSFSDSLSTFNDRHPGLSQDSRLSDAFLSTITDRSLLRQLQTLQANPALLQPSATSSIYGHNRRNNNTFEQQYQLHQIVREEEQRHLHELLSRSKLSMSELSANHDLNKLLQHKIALLKRNQRQLEELLASSGGQNRGSQSDHQEELSSTLISLLNRGNSLSTQAQVSNSSSLAGLSSEALTSHILNQFRDRDTLLTNPSLVDRSNLGRRDHLPNVDRLLASLSQSFSTHNNPQDEGTLRSQIMSNTLEGLLSSHQNTPEASISSSATSPMMNRNIYNLLQRQQQQQIRDTASNTLSISDSLLNHDPYNDMLLREQIRRTISNNGSSTGSGIDSLLNSYQEDNAAATDKLKILLEMAKKNNRGRVEP